MIKLLLPLLFLAGCTNKSLNSYINTCSIKVQFRLQEIKYKGDSIMTTYESYLEIDAANMSTSEQDTLQYLDNQDFNANNCEKFELESRLSRLQYALEVLLIKVNEKKP